MGNSGQWYPNQQGYQQQQPMYGSGIQQPMYGSGIQQPMYGSGIQQSMFNSGQWQNQPQTQLCTDLLQRGWCHDYQHVKNNRSGTYNDSSHPPKIIRCPFLGKCNRECPFQHPNPQNNYYVTYVENYPNSQFLIQQYPQKLQSCFYLCNNIVTQPNTICQLFISNGYCPNILCPYQHTSYSPNQLTPNSTGNTSSIPNTVSPTTSINTISQSAVEPLPSPSEVWVEVKEQDKLSLLNRLFNDILKAGPSFTEVNEIKNQVLSNRYITHRQNHGGSQHSEISVFYIAKNSERNGMYISINGFDKDCKFDEDQGDHFHLCSSALDAYRRASGNFIVVCTLHYVEDKMTFDKNENLLTIPTAHADAVLPKYVVRVKTRN
eukprot:TRINITY_DN1201_c0_g1_i1.p1 TRINITY_DN1201_c0_g1~~TRINITY_DN1201_c0_g1_i1.p1  ORF type:complete len:392 (-),score=42.99 TRINITY_DN1201_c0_g1_i1:38-1165(-)